MEKRIKAMAHPLPVGTLPYPIERQQEEERPV
jgi:hypothetical protein